VGYRLEHNRVRNLVQSANAVPVAESNYDPDDRTPRHSGWIAAIPFAAGIGYDPAISGFTSAGQRS